MSTRRGTLMIQGTTSDAGKSTLVAGLCRVLHQGGASVAPFKPQNMALNSAVTVDGGEIGRAQALQAQAAGLEPHTDMNPVLLKPCSDTDAQVVIQGKVRGDMSARDYHLYKSVAMNAVLESYERLRRRHRLIIVEGAGSPAEVNLRDRDIANMGFAEAVDCPVVLVADIDRGGVFAHFVGTLECLSETERERVKGFVINRFRGDPELLQPGMEWLQERTGKPVFGVLPYLHGLHLDAEDAIAGKDTDFQSPEPKFSIVVPVLPRISNHTDFDVLRAHGDVALRFVGPNKGIPHADLIILPGSKNVRGDLRWLIDQGWDAAIKRHLRYGGKVMGICGGMQMLGRKIHDPDGVEGERGSTRALGILDFETTLQREKALRRVSGHLAIAPYAEVVGYEIHMGWTDGPALRNPALDLNGRRDGAVSRDGQVLATYVHGIFDEPKACAALLEWAGLRTSVVPDREALRERSLERIAIALETHLRLDALLAATIG